MYLIRGLHNLTTHAGSVVTIGNFDGIHVGHQKIIKQLVKKARTLNLPSVLISFTPTPQAFFGHPQATLTHFKEKHQLLGDLGLDEHLIIKFNPAFSQLTGVDFIQQILLEKLNMKQCLIGDDFRFGKNREGDFTLLKSLAKTGGFEVENTQSVLCNNHRASSSDIRTLLTQGDLATAAQILGREFSIAGRISRGQQQGRTIGFPTINIAIKRNISPVLGVFAVHVMLNHQTYQGVCNVGKRPTVGGTKIVLEVFLFEFKASVYGCHACVIFKHKIRDELKFDSFDQLKQQIKRDVTAAQQFFYA